MGRARRSYKSSSFDPSALTGGAVTAWLRNSTLSGNISSVTDVLNSNPAVQSVDARRPEGSADGSLTYLTNDVLSWPVHASNNGSSCWGFATGIELDATGAVNQTLACITLITGGASARKINVVKNTSDRFTIDIYINDTDGRRFATTTTNLTTASTFISVQIDTSKSPESNQVKVTIGGVSQAMTASNLGVGGSLSGLVVPTGFMLIGNGRDGAANAPFQGRMAKNWYQLGASMSGVTHGLITDDALSALAAMEPLV